MTDLPLLPTAAPGSTPTRVMTIAGSDSGGGAGIQADMRTFALLGLHACVAVTAVTVQNSLGVSGFQEIAPDVVAAQMRCVIDDIGVSAAKTGMLASAPIIDAVVAQCHDSGLGRDAAVPLVVDPVCASMHGDPLLAVEALDTLRTKLIPIATVVTPNLDEVRLITGIDVVDDGRYLVRAGTDVECLPATTADFVDLVTRLIDEVSGPASTDRRITSM